uniref:Inositol hexakisphosphate and diphosphoinositol-pentakisphosphate kinase n=1 Tax=Corethron hystrix TaxID=216773 RepID=A0A7S1FV16_9STRA
MSRDGYISTGSQGGDGSIPELVEYDDHIEINGVAIYKPFVEKPVNAEDHEIHIYYPTSAGGGYKKLFRKVGNRSSEFYPDINEVRREGSFIYEDFLETQGTDVKMYTVGPDYGHAEARKSPTLDGSVVRNPDGKELRFPVIPSLREKEIARRIVLVFKQYVCGFDLLRVEEGDSKLVPFCCDVNGFSFVKSSRKYYDDCAQLISEYVIAAIKPRSVPIFSALNPLMKTTANYYPETPKRATNFLRDTSGGTAHFRHPQLVGAGVDQEALSQASLPETGASPIRSVDLPSTLADGAPPVRDMSDQLSIEFGASRSRCPSVSSSVGENSTGQMSQLMGREKSGTHQEELRCVIAVIRHGDRTPKQKLKSKVKYPEILDFFHKYSSKSSRKDLKVKGKGPLSEFLDTINRIITGREKAGQKRMDPEMYKLHHMRDILVKWKFEGLNRKLQMKPQEWETILDEKKNVAKEVCTKVLLILKWGGNLTKLGEKQAITLGERLRKELYPDAPGGGILRLHSTFRHDLKIRTSDEGRVMKTAAAFAKGMLQLEGDLPPIVVSLVHKDSMHMLDPSGNKVVKQMLDKCKERIHVNLPRDYDFKEGSMIMRETAVGPSSLISLHTALKQIRNPRKVLHEIHEIIGELLTQLDEMLGSMGSHDEYGGEVSDETILYDVCICVSILLLNNIFPLLCV